MDVSSEMPVFCERRCCEQLMLVRMSRANLEDALGVILGLVWGSFEAASTPSKTCQCDVTHPTFPPNVETPNEKTRTGWDRRIAPHRR
eukprot:6669532-Pyramimonas_sp.AAC.1